MLIIGCAHHIGHNMNHTEDTQELLERRATGSGLKVHLQERDKHRLERVDGKTLNSGGEWCFSLMNSVSLPFLRKENLICIKHYHHFGTCLMQWAR